MNAIAAFQVDAEDTLNRYDEAHRAWTTESAMWPSMSVHAQWKEARTELLNLLHSLREENERLNKRFELMAEKTAESFEMAVEYGLQADRAKALSEREADFFEKLHAGFKSLRSEWAELKEGLQVYAHRGNWQDVISGRIQWNGVEEEPWTIAQSILATINEPETDTKSNGEDVQTGEVTHYTVHPKGDEWTDDGHTWTWRKTYKANRNESGFWICSNEGQRFFDRDEWHLVDEKFILDEI